MKKATPKAINMKVLPETLDRVSAIFGDKSGPAINGACETILTAYARTLREVKGQFTRPELNLIIDALNGTWILSGLAGQHVLANCEDHIALNRADAMHGVDAAVFLPRLRGLTMFQLVTLEMWAMQFWNGEYNDTSFVEGHFGLLLNEEEAANQ